MLYVCNNTSLHCTTLQCVTKHIIIIYAYINVLLSRTQYNHSLQLSITILMPWPKLMSPRPLSTPEKQQWITPRHSHIVAFFKCITFSTITRPWIGDPPNTGSIFCKSSDLLMVLLCLSLYSHLPSSIIYFDVSSLPKQLDVLHIFLHCFVCI